MACSTLRSSGSTCSTTSSPSSDGLNRTATRLDLAQDGPTTVPCVPFGTTSNCRSAATRSPGPSPPVHGMRWISAGTTFRLLTRPSSRLAKATVTRPLGSVALWPTTVPTTPRFTTMAPLTRRSLAAATLSPRRKPPAITKATSSARTSRSAGPPPGGRLSSRTTSRARGSSAEGPNTTPLEPASTGGQSSCDTVCMTCTRAPTSKPPAKYSRISVTTQFRRFRLPSSR
mmetsp:Transcript_87256/g.242039  ORF Transcript_87256/g.242039 Transcript_87256/m.242039 type:complete len:229 (+) Transcript_87256:646-1332(+)